MQQKQITLLDFYDTHLKLSDGEVILDVRNPDEFKEAHISQALNIPLPDLVARSAELKTFKKIYVHCKRGGRAKTAFDSLQNMGFQNVVCVYDAGIDLWLEKGYPVERG